MAKSEQDYFEELSDLLAKAQCLNLAAAIDNDVQASLIPFLYFENSFWIFVSDLSPHTRFLSRAQKVAILLYDNQNPPANPFAVFRVSYECKPVKVERDEKILTLMTEKLGQTVELLKQLGDFNLYKLEPNSGRLIAGFGQAFDIDIQKQTLSLIKPEKG